ncbi:Conserved_hypothetical protein [Hexamita inflata]|uniref:Uncharacterized protein n=2 Tax=Hexamita inflata TaxID=28002 RepID=A0AA86QTV9_9EUKA|nr:Conserved hypothetical protein [Hexamita inflata]
MNTPKILPQIFQSENHKKYGVVDSNVNKFEKISPNRVYSVNKQPKPVNLIRQAKSQAQQYNEKSLSSRPSSCADDLLSDEQIEHEVENIKYDKVEIESEEQIEQPNTEIQLESHIHQSQSVEDQKQLKQIDTAQKTNRTEQTMKPSTQIKYNQNPQQYIGQPVQNTEQNFNLIPLKPQFKLFKKQSQNDLKIKREKSKEIDVLSAFLSENLQPVKNEPQKTVKRSKKRQIIQDAVIIQQEMNQKDLISNIINDQIGDQIEDDLEVDLDANFEEMIPKPIMMQIVQPTIDLAEKEQKEQDKNHNNTVSEVKIDLNKDNQDNITQNTLNNQQSEVQVELKQNNENIQLKNYSNLNENNIQQIQQITETIQNYNIQQQYKEANPIHEQTKEETTINKDYTINNDSVETKIIQKQYEIESQTKIPKETNKTENVKQLSLAENMKPQNINQNENQLQLQSNYQHIKENISLSDEQNINEHKPKQQHQVEQQHKMKPQIEPQQPSSIKPQQSNTENELNLIRKAEAERQQRELKRIIKEKELKSMKLLLATEETLRRETLRQEMLQQEKEHEQVKLARIQQEKILQEIMIQDAIKQQKVQEVQKQQQNEIKPENKQILKATSTPMLNKEKMKERADQINFQNIQRQKINKIQEDLKFLRKVLENQVKSGSDKLKGLKQSVKVNEEYLKQLENCTTIKELDKICAKYQDKLEDLIIEIKR